MKPEEIEWRPDTSDYKKMFEELRQDHANIRQENLEWYTAATIILQSCDSDIIEVIKYRRKTTEFGEVVSCYIRDLQKEIDYLYKQLKGGTCNCKNP